MTEPVTSQAALESSGLPADRRHGQAPLTGPGYPHETGPYPGQPQGSYGPSGIEDDLGSWALPSELPRADAPVSARFDSEKGNHGGPFPAWGATYGETRNGAAQAQAQTDSMADHAADFGMGDQRMNVYGHDFQGAHFRQTYAESAGITQQAGGVPDQLKTTGGGDRVQGWDKGNPVFQVGHILKRDQADGVPYNQQWLGAVHRPMVIRYNGDKNTFDGQDSPYGPAGNESVDMMQTPGSGVSVLTDPTPYTPPADPTYGAQPVLASTEFADW